MSDYSRLRRFLVASLLAALILLEPVPGRDVAAAIPAAGASQAKGTGSAKNGAQATKKSTAKKPRARRRSSRRRRRPGQLRPAADRIREIQGALIAKGYLKTEATGQWDAAATSAMQRFQQENGLEPTGRLDARSLIKLGLGPETAGVGAPRTPAAPAAGPSAERPASSTSPPGGPGSPPG